MDREQLALRAHELGMHDDYWFHQECPTCVEHAVDSYLNECHELLRAITKDAIIPAFDTHLKELPHDTLVWILHDAPMYIIADYLGIQNHGTNDAEFQIIEQAAASIRPQSTRR